MSERDTIRQALYDAIGWQQSLADAWASGTPERAEAQDQVRHYRALLKKRYGDRRLPSERTFADAREVTLDELRAMQPVDREPT